MPFFTGGRCAGLGISFCPSGNQPGAGGDDSISLALVSKTPCGRVA
jgi:hypothetical protein